MKHSFQDGITEKFEIKMEDYGTLVEEFTMKNLKRTTREVIDYLNDIRCTVTPGLALRRYMCTKFATKTENGYVFTIRGGETIHVADYSDEAYNIEKDELDAYTRIFTYINEKYNSDGKGTIISNINDNEARRLLKVTTSFSRQKMFEISFALHMDSEDMFKFLTDYLAEPYYNYRNPYEVIALYCHTHEEQNNYVNYLRLTNEYDEKCQLSPESKAAISNYTEFATRFTKENIKTEEDLFKFLLDNRANFNGYSQTAYDEFMALYKKALKKTQYQALSNDSHVMYKTAGNRQDMHEIIESAYTSRQLRQVDNNDLLAKSILSVPRITEKKYKRDGSYEVSSDFMNITNTATSKKPQTTLLPKAITKNLPLRGRLDDLVNQKKPVERKDLVFFKFYNFYLQTKELEEKTDNFKLTSTLCNVFITECNNMLVRCGMSKLYAANRFENLILLSLYADNPFEFFEIIIEHSFIYEAEYVEVGKRGRKKKTTEDTNE